MSTPKIPTNPLSIILHYQNSMYYNVLFREDGNPVPNVNIELINNTPDTITLSQASSQSVSDSNYHFSLNLPVSALVNPDDISLISSTNWAFTYKSIANHYYFYFLYTNGSLTIDNENPEIIELRNLIAKSFKQYNSLVVNLELICSSLVTIDGTSMKNVSTQNTLAVCNFQYGIEIPMRAEFSGPDFVINDGTVNKNPLILHLLNNSDTITVGFTNKSIIKIKLAFDNKTKLPSSLTSFSNAPTISMTNGGFTATHVANSPEYLFTSNYNQSLDKGTPYIFTISNIITDYPAGNTYLTIEYKNITGFPDGELAIPIRKTPIQLTENGMIINRNADTLISLTNKNLGGCCIEAIANTTNAIGCNSVVAINKGIGSALKATKGDDSVYQVTEIQKPATQSLCYGNEMAIGSFNTSSKHPTIYARNGGPVSYVQDPSSYYTVTSGVVLHAENTSELNTINAINKGAGFALKAHSASGSAISATVGNGGTALNCSSNAGTTIDCSSGNGTTINCSTGNAASIVCTNNSLNSPTIQVTNKGYMDGEYTYHNGANCAIRAESNSPYTATIYAKNNGYDYNTGPAIKADGDLQYTGKLSSSSSIKYKKDIQDIKNEYSDKIHELKPKLYNLKDERFKKGFHGLIAEDVDEIYPEIVDKDKDGNPDGISYVELIPIMIHELQKQKKEIESLKKQVQSAKSKRRFFWFNRKKS